MVNSTFKFHVNDNYGQTKLSKIIPANSVTNIWLQDEPLEKN